MSEFISESSRQRLNPARYFCKSQTIWADRQRNAESRETQASASSLCLQHWLSAQRARAVWACMDGNPQSGAAMC